MEKGTQSKRAEMYRSVFNSTPNGKWVLADILREAGVGQSLFAIDQHAQNRNVARHDFAVGIADLAEPEKEK